MKPEFFQQKKQEFKGKELEEQYLGYPIDWSLIFAKHNIQPENLTRIKWIEVFKKYYPLNSQIPKKKWGKDIFNFVAEALHLNPEDPKELHFYNALDSGLDKQGIDCLFLFKNPKTEKEAIFTIDLTTNPKKREWKAHMILGEFPDYRSQLEEYIEEMEEKAKKIAQGLINKTGPITH